MVNWLCYISIELCNFHEEFVGRIGTLEVMSSMDGHILRYRVEV